MRRAGVSQNRACWRNWESSKRIHCKLLTADITTHPYRKKPLQVVCGGSVFGRDAKAKPTGKYSRRLPEQTTHRGPTSNPRIYLIHSAARIASVHPE